MKLIIKIMQPKHKTREIESYIGPSTTLEQARKIWETEQILNNLPGCDLRFHFHLEGDTQDDL